MYMSMDESRNPDKIFETKSSRFGSGLGKKKIIEENNLSALPSKP